MGVGGLEADLMLEAGGPGLGSCGLRVLFYKKG